MFTSKGKKELISQSSKFKAIEIKQIVVLEAYYLNMY